MICDEDTAWVAYNKRADDRLLYEELIISDFLKSFFYMIDNLLYYVITSPPRAGQMT